jgi:SulP family sulfate permease
MAGTRHDSNQELIGQGIANIAAPLFGGFAATGAIARTATNIRSGASSPLAGMVHSAVLLLVILLLAPLASTIPLCCLSAILFVVSWNMSELPHVLRLVRTAPKTDVAVLMLTFFLTVFVDLVVAVNVGVIVAALLFMRRSADAVHVDRQTAEEIAAGVSTPRALDPGLVIYSIEGPLFFAAAEKLERTLAQIQRPATTLILRMGSVPFMDATGIDAVKEIIQDFKRHGATVLLVELRPNVRYKLQRGGVIAELGEAHVIDTLQNALQLVSGLNSAPTAAQPIQIKEENPHVD